MENFSKENALKVTKQNATNTPLKPCWRIAIFQLSPGNRLHRIEQSGVASSEMEQLSVKQRESARLKESAKNAKQEPNESSSVITVRVH